MGLFKKKPLPETVERIKEIAREPLYDGYSQPRENTTASSIELCALKTREEIEDEKWEQRQYDMARQLVLQYVRSCVLGKMKASPKDIARKARIQAYEFVREMRKEIKPNTEENGNA